jgi:phosphoglycerate dehydrogenase-like enzyme
MAEPRVLSLTPAEALAAAYERVGAGLAPHDLLSAERSPAGLAAALPTADYVLGDWTHELRLDANALAMAPRCRVIIQPTAGTDSIDTEQASQLGIPVANTPGVNARAVAEWTVMAILALLKDVWRYHEGMQQGRWEMVAAGRRGVHELGDRTVGIVGLGRIGQDVARRLAPFDLSRLVYVDPVAAAPERERALGVERVELDELCAVSDAVTLHLPLTDTTRGLFDARRLARLRPDAVVVNVARGAILDERALAAALDAGRLRGAALDVFAQEPPPADHPLKGRPNVLLSPHLAGSTNEARDRMITAALHNLDRVMRGGAPHNVVNAVSHRRIQSAIDNTRGRRE